MSIKSLESLGLKSRSQWAKAAGVSACLLSLILGGKKPLTRRVQRLLALAAGVPEDTVPALLASTRKRVRA